jgi:hypothetical protein
MEPESSTPTTHSPVRSGAMGTFVAAWFLSDALVVLGVILLAAWLNPLLVFIVAAVVLTVINLVCCNWIDRDWDGWMARYGKRVEKKLEKMRKGRIMRHPVGWITGGSEALFGLAAALTNAITAVAFARLIGGQKVGERRTFVAAASFGVFCAGLGSLIGFAAGDVIRAL